jgi:predicted transposase YbfD/YdcC
MGLFAVCFEDLPDPRTGNARRHDLLEVLAIALAACMCGAESCVDFADFAASKAAVLREFLRLENGLPSHDTFSRIFRLLDPVAFSACFIRFVEALAAAVEAERPRADGVVAIDGKTLRRSFDRAAETSPFHLVSAFASDLGLVLGQVEAIGPDEIRAARTLLGLLDLSGRVVTADALHCQKETAQAILDRGADYVLALKANQGTLLADLKHLLASGEVAPSDTALTSAVSHGRHEVRKAALYHLPQLGAAHRFPGLQAIAVIESRRTIGTKTTTAERCFCLSKDFAASRVLALVRAHWTIENQLHWVLDVALDEDHARNRKDNGPENLAMIRRLALNLLRQNPLNHSIRRKIKRAGWDNAFLINVIAQMR